MVRWLAILSVLVSTAWADEPTAEELAFFESRVRPLLVQHCAECHSAEAKAVKGGLRLDTAEMLKKGGDSGAAVVPGNPEESLLIEAVRYAGDVQMPPAGKLPDRDIATLEEWVRRGAVFPKTEAATAGQKRTIDIAAGKEFWSLRPLQRSSPSQVERADWPKTSIDPYVLAGLESRKLAPSPRADRRTLIRRAYFDLIGMPPDPEDVEAFVADDAPEAWSRLIDSLLASPRYGERWGRYWLDLVRYCDIPESWAKTDAQAWLYRDWVVQALNDDLPYDQFVKRQLASDQLPECGPRDVAALGFLGLSPTYWKELKLAPDVIKTVVAEEWEERITAVSGTLLGLTVGCARCHDHKFDPVTQQDYYALAGIFASVRQVSVPMLAPAEAKRVVEARQEFQRLEEEAKRLKAAADREKKAQAEPPKEAKPVPKPGATSPALIEALRRGAELAKNAADASQQAADALAKALELKSTTPNFDAPMVYAVEDASLAVLPDGPNRTKLEYAVGSSQNVAMQVRGNPAKTLGVVPRRYLAVLSPEEPAAFTQGSGRRELAEAIFRDSAPLAARVIVNRVWRHHFGRGLVDTPSNFGTQGARPSHPELLDELSARFIDSGWSLKWLHRELMLSAAYQQTSAVSENLQVVDPDNVLLGRMNRRRLEVEAWRDAMLTASGSLDPRIGGAPRDLAEAAHVRRTLYATILRRELPDLLRLYDFPDPTGHSPARIDTTTPLQQLFVLNSEFLGRQARALHERIQREASGNVPAMIRTGYSVLYGREPSSKEQEIAEQYLGAAPTPERWQEFLEVLLARNELLFVD